VVDLFDGGAYRRLLLVSGRPLLLTVEQEGTPARAVLRVSLAGEGARAGEARAAAERVLCRALGAGLDIRPFYRKFRDDTLLGPPIKAFRGLRIAGWASLWEALVTTVLTQQVNLTFAYDIRRELALAFGRRGRGEGETYYAFPTPERLAREPVGRLLGFRLSRAKAETISRLAHAFCQGGLSDEALRGLPDEEAVERLTAVKGIGRWTAETVLLRGLGRPDAFPGGDLGVVKYLAQGLLNHRTRASEADMRQFAEAWRPYRGLALVYAYAELARRRQSP
jgi:DNA-3-methyladenine glycosylase II